MTGQQIAMAGDTARTGRDDPWSSHLAGDRSQATIRAVRDAVLILVRQELIVTGSELNDLYRVRAEQNGWPAVHYESPRKRAGELAKDGLLSVLNAEVPRGTQHEYTIAVTW
ncbi:hypothetical protein [Glaciihabitans sp. UYNi722]|uniref:hypothetical protein n=1 Tax=Glaciihabitans sp. UYNi722 TaxID=3156344 RepID=UPI003398BFB3